ncbi:5'(3')-deoxyribonucleotidase, cytosolic type-like [Tubulanus polymorphus]|uniref:5'(3')-deoxyribonucleotidase, cytosolic type-like n=1 Tax=Tubulanus polymorphus TaxID=672921 RepID=UPI003DA4B9F8
MSSSVNNDDGSRNNVGTRRRNGPIHERKKVVVLVDMDGVLADFELNLLESYRAANPDEPFVPLDERRGFWVNKQYRGLRDDLADRIMDVVHAKGFFLNNEPIVGAVAAVKELSAMDGVEVFICTSPVTTSYEHCAPEKYAWIEQYFGSDWLRRIILTTDKTVVGGDVLVDDKMDIHGVRSRPSWEHVVFTAPANVRVDAGDRLRLETWADLPKLKSLIKSKLA